MPKIPCSLRLFISATLRESFTSGHMRAQLKDLLKHLNTIIFLRCTRYLRCAWDGLGARMKQTGGSCGSTPDPWRNSRCSLQINTYAEKSLVLRACIRLHARLEKLQWSGLQSQLQFFACNSKHIEIKAELHIIYWHSTYRFTIIFDDLLWLVSLPWYKASKDKHYSLYHSMIPYGWTRVTRGFSSSW